MATLAASTSSYVEWSGRLADTLQLVAAVNDVATLSSSSSDSCSVTVLGPQRRPISRCSVARNVGLFVEKWLSLTIKSTVDFSRVLPLQRRRRIRQQRRCSVPPAVIDGQLQETDCPDHYPAMGNNNGTGRAPHRRSSRGRSSKRPTSAATDYEPPPQTPVSSTFSLPDYYRYPSSSTAEAAASYGDIAGAAGYYFDLAGSLDDIRRRTVGTSVDSRNSSSSDLGQLMGSRARRAGSADGYQQRQRGHFPAAHLGVRAANTVPSQTGDQTVRTTGYDVLASAGVFDRWKTDRPSNRELLADTSTDSDLSAEVRKVMEAGKLAAISDQIGFVQSQHRLSTAVAAPRRLAAAAADVGVDDVDHISADGGKTSDAFRPTRHFLGPDKGEFAFVGFSGDEQEADYKTRSESHPKAHSKATEKDKTQRNSQSNVFYTETSGGNSRSPFGGTNRDDQRRDQSTAGGDQRAADERRTAAETTAAPLTRNNDRNQTLIIYTRRAGNDQQMLNKFDQQMSVSTSNEADILAETATGFHDAVTSESTATNNANYVDHGSPNSAAGANRPEDETEHKNAENVPDERLNTTSQSTSRRDIERPGRDTPTGQTSSVPVISNDRPEDQSPHRLDSQRKRNPVDHLGNNLGANSSGDEYVSTEEFTDDDSSHVDADEIAYAHDFETADDSDNSLYLSSPAAVVRTETAGCAANGYPGHGVNDKDGTVAADSGGRADSAGNIAAAAAMFPAGAIDVQQQQIIKNAADKTAPSEGDGIVGSFLIDNNNGGDDDDDCESVTGEITIRYLSDEDVERETLEPYSIEDVLACSAYSQCDVPYMTAIDDEYSNAAKDDLQLYEFDQNTVEPAQFEQQGDVVVVNLKSDDDTPAKEIGEISAETHLQPTSDRCHDGDSFNHASFACICSCSNSYDVSDSQPTVSDDANISPPQNTADLNTEFLRDDLTSGSLLCNVSSLPTTVVVDSQYSIAAATKTTETDNIDGQQHAVSHGLDSSISLKTDNHFAPTGIQKLSSIISWQQPIAMRTETATDTAKGFADRVDYGANENSFVTGDQADDSEHSKNFTASPETATMTVDTAARRTSAHDRSSSTLSSSSSATVSSYIHAVETRGRIPSLSDFNAVNAPDQTPHPGRSRDNDTSTSIVNDERRLGPLGIDVGPFRTLSSRYSSDSATQRNTQPTNSNYEKTSIPDDLTFTCQMNQQRTKPFTQSAALRKSVTAGHTWLSTDAMHRGVSSVCSRNEDPVHYNVLNEAALPATDLELSMISDVHQSECGSQSSRVSHGFNTARSSSAGSDVYRPRAYRKTANDEQAVSHQQISAEEMKLQQQMKLNEEALLALSDYLDQLTSRQRPQLNDLIYANRGHVAGPRSSSSTSLSSLSASHRSSVRLNSSDQQNYAMPRAEHTGSNSAVSYPNTRSWSTSATSPFQRPTSRNGFYRPPAPQTTRHLNNGDRLTGPATISTAHQKMNFPLSAHNGNIGYRYSLPYYRVGMWTNA